MPGLSPIKILGNVKFMSNNLKLPTQKASGDAKGWGEKYFRDRDQEPGEMTGAPRVIPPWFLPQKPGYKHHQKSCDEIGKAFKDFHDAMIDAVQFAHQMWKLQAKFQNLKVMAIAAMGTPGCLDGPELESLIKQAPSCAAFTGNMAKHRDAVATGVSKAFKNWQGQVTVPGLPWYPAFAAFPGPMAPPMPNIPMPLICCVSAKMTDIILPDTMTKEMDDALDGASRTRTPRSSITRSTTPSPPCSRSPSSCGCPPSK